MGARQFSLHSPYYSQNNQREVCAPIIFREASIQSHKVPIAISYATFFMDDMDTMDLLADKENQETLLMIQSKAFTRISILPRELMCAP